MLAHEVKGPGIRVAGRDAPRPGRAARLRAGRTVHPPGHRAVRPIRAASPCHRSRPSRRRRPGRRRRRHAPGASRPARSGCTSSCSPARRPRIRCCGAPPRRRGLARRRAGPTGGSSSATGTRTGTCGCGSTARRTGCCSETLPMLHAASRRRCSTTGQLWRVQLDTYEREVERYGGEAGIGLAERVFHADSDAVLAIVRQLGPCVQSVLFKASGAEHRAAEHWGGLFIDQVNIDVTRGRLTAGGRLRDGHPADGLAAGHPDGGRLPGARRAHLAGHDAERGRPGGRVSRSAGHAGHQRPATAAARQLHAAHQRRPRHPARAGRRAYQAGAPAQRPYPGRRRVLLLRHARAVGGQ